MSKKQQTMHASNLSCKQHAGSILKGPEFAAHPAGVSAPTGHCKHNNMNEYIYVCSVFFLKNAS